MLMVIGTSNQLSKFIYFFKKIYSKNEYFCSFCHSTIINSSNYLQQVFSIEILEIIWLGES